MAAATEIYNDRGTKMLSAGQGSQLFQVITASFPTTDTTCTINVNMTVVRAVFLASAVAAATEKLSWADGVSGPYAVPATGVITISRDAGTTSGLTFYALVIGF